MRSLQPRYWCIYCDEGEYPGLWRIWEDQQVVTLGYPPKCWRDWFSFEHRKGSTSWRGIVNRLNEMRPGDYIVARLPHHRIGRVGQILRLEVKDSDWDPLVRKSKQHPHGEQGRIIIVRWDFGKGPTNREYACAIPLPYRFGPGKLRKTITDLSPRQYSRFERVLADSANWAPVFGHSFKTEEALSDFIAAHPEHLEPGLKPYPFIKSREAKVRKSDRLDVLLEDAGGRCVVVECKQGFATPTNVAQLRRYLGSVRKKLGLSRRPRGILVFGGAPSVTKAVRKEARKARIELYSHLVNVEFTRVAVD